MPKKRKAKQTAEERRQEEIRRRIQKAEEKKQAPKQAAVPKPKTEKTQTRAQAPQAIEKAPERPAIENRTGARNGRRRKSHVPSCHERPVPMKLLQLHDAGDAGAECRNYDVVFPARMDLGGLLKAIRDGNYMSAGTVYISAGLAQAGPCNADMSYELKGGVYTRTDMPDKKARKSTSWLTDLIDRPVAAVRAAGGWGSMAWFVDLRPEIRDTDPVSTPEGMDPSELITEGAGT